MALEEEAQICRLCGQCESIYIDVFGEEGTKRYLGLKIHTKINILIQEDDGLSRKVCMRCIGTLEFVSDFHNKCHQTQRQLLLDKERLQTLPKQEIKTDFESDKENISPHTNTERTEDSVSLLAQLKRKSSRMESKLGKLKKITYKDVVFGDNLISGLDNVENLEPNRIAVYSEAEHWTEMKRSAIELKGNIIMERNTAVSRTRNPLATEMNKESGNRDGQKKVPLTRHGRRKNGRRGSSASITNRNIRKIEKRVPASESGKKTLVESCTTESGASEKVEASIGSSKEEQNNGQGLSTRFLSITEEELNGSKRVLPEMVKIEALDSVVILSPDGPGQEATSGSTAKSPRPGDEAGETQARGCDVIAGQMKDNTSKISCTEDDYMGAKSSPKVLMIRKSVIESVKNGTTIRIDTEHGLISKNTTDAQLTLLDDDVTPQINGLKLTEVPESFGRSTNLQQESTGVISKELNRDKARSVGNFRERRKKSEGQFGRLSELITNEQKEIIETMYTVNMGVIDDAEVYRNIKILDKVKVKCEICGKTYPRMDKCQVHVWGHLNMKPYCCKSCDFVTLTVSNIRCHIKKRHLKIKPFQCNLCDKTYGTAVLLEEHINSHTGAKPYTCKLCDFATSNRQVLSYHKTTHKPVKNRMPQP